MITIIFLHQLKLNGLRMNELRYQLLLHKEIGDHRNERMDILVSSCNREVLHSIAQKELKELLLRRRRRITWWQWWRQMEEQGGGCGGKVMFSISSRMPSVCVCMLVSVCYFACAFYIPCCHGMYHIRFFNAHVLFLCQPLLSCLCQFGPVLHKPVSLCSFFSPRSQNS